VRGGEAIEVQRCVEATRQLEVSAMLKRQGGITRAYCGNHFR